MTYQFKTPDHLIDAERILTEVETTVRDELMPLIDTIADVSAQTAAQEAINNLEGLRNDREALDEALTRCDPDPAVEAAAKDDMVLRLKDRIRKALTGTTYATIAALDDVIPTPVPVAIQLGDMKPEEVGEVIGRLMHLWRSIDMADFERGLARTRPL